jgi:parallel beta-helix repeat protein
LLSGGGNNTLLGNIANNNSRGFYLGGGNNTLKGNAMDLGGIYTYGSINEMTSQRIDDSNLLNNKPIYYYGNEIGLKPDDFLNAGQIILINCNDSLISDVNISNCYNGIYLDYSNNNTIEECIVNNNIENGIRMENSFNNKLSKNNVSFNLKDGISFSCSNITLRNNTASNNQQSGIIAGGDNNFFIENKANNNQGNGIYTGGINNFLIENEANYNNQCGIKIQGDNNIILDNCAFNNILWGIKLFGQHNNASGNAMKNCGISVSVPQWRSTCFVDTSNTVNEKPVYFYNDEIGLNSNNFSNAGQVLLNNCNNSLISNLDISNATIGISLFLCNNNTISENIANNNHYFGIEFSGNNNTLSGNIMNNNKDSGLYLNGNNNKLIGNSMCSNIRYGIYPMMSTCDFNLFVENNISNNGEMGILLTPGSTDNLFYRNIFYGNGLNAEDSGFFGGNNKWDNGIVGNYWGDYTGTDLNNDGIGDSPYNVSGTANSQDNFPILDIDPPNITINFPSNYDVFGSNAPDFNVEIIEPHIDKMWYTINNGATSIIFTLNGTINQALWDTLPEGNVTIRFYANDTVGNVYFQEIIIIKAIPQLNPPEIPGYDILLFLVGLISVMVVILIKKRIKHLD